MNNVQDRFPEPISNSSDSSDCFFVQPLSQNMKNILFYQRKAEYSTS